MTPDTAAADPALNIVEETAGALDEAASETAAAARHLRLIQSERRAGRRWADVLGDGTPRELLGLLGSAGRRVSLATARLRRAFASALLHDGLRVGQIADHLGVSHQRVSQVLNHTRGAGDESAPGTAGQPT